MQSPQNVFADRAVPREHDTYLNWLAKNTPTEWWVDSADPQEIQDGRDRGAVGVTTNPVLSAAALHSNREVWAADIQEVHAKKLPAAEKAEGLMQIPVRKAAEQLLPEFKASHGERGYVCAQVSPMLVGDRSAMLAMARRLHAWAPNICVKLPATSAGIDTLEACAAEGISTNATVSFTLPQLLGVGEKNLAGARRAKEKGIRPAKSFATMMIGRLDDYLREVADDHRVEVSEDDVRHSGIAVVKRAYALYRERGYETMLLGAALRGAHHLAELAGGDLVLSIPPGVQEQVLAQPLVRECGIETPVPDASLERLSRIREFVRAYEPGGMTPNEFVTYGATQRTVGQFVENGWKVLESFRVNTDANAEPVEKSFQG